MVTRTRLRSILTALGLYVMAALLIGYFGVNAFSGDRGLKAQKDIDQQISSLSVELGHLKVERGQWERRLALLKSKSIDPDMLDERARALLDYTHPNELTLMVGEPGHASSAALKSAPALSK
jgi:cell division protein FtsB